MGCLLKEKILLPMLPKSGVLTCLRARPSSAGPDDIYNYYMMTQHLKFSTTLFLIDIVDFQKLRSAQFQENISRSENISFVLAQQ